MKMPQPAALPLILSALLSPNLMAADPLPPLVPGRLDWDFVGNSFSDFADDAENGVGRWVQNFVDEIEVAPDGTVIVACDWDEGGRCLGLYKDGRPAGAAPGKNDRRGGHRNGGWGTSSSAVAVIDSEILCASNDGEFFRFRWTPGDLESARFANSTPHGHGDAVNDPKAVKFIALHARGPLIAAALADGRIEIRHRTDLAVRQTFAAPGAHDLVWSADDRLWLAFTNAVREFTPEGQATGRTLPDPGTPSAIAFSPQGELVVCDDGPRQQVRFYDLAGTQPQLVETFGQPGGISAGTPGQPAPDKLMRPAGANRDAAGNLYIALRYDAFTPTGGCILRSFDPAGRLRWEAACHVFSETWDIVPEADGSLTAYGFRSIFRKPPGAPRGDWRCEAITLDSLQQPEDPRHRHALQQATTAWRRLDGADYLFTWGSGGNSPLEITRLNARGLLGQHVATLGRPGPWAFGVDARGDVWHDDNHRTLLRRRHLGQGRWGDPETFPLPAPLTEVHRLIYDAGTDVLYVSGYTTNHPKPKGEWGLMGRALARINHFTTTPQLAWSTALHIDDDNLPPKAVCQAGDYLFTAACKPTHGLRGQIYVHRASDGHLVGRISAPKAIAQNTGWVDLSHGLRARERNGTYYLAQEDNLRAKVILHTWTPPPPATNEVSLHLDTQSSGRVFEGIGTLSAGATSALLSQYPEAIRSDILDLLFKPGFGASFQHLKVEIGSGMNSTCGAEPSHVITPDELAHPVPRGYELWLAAEARKRNPAIVLDALPWGTPYWTTNFTTPEAAKWVIAFLQLARRHYGLEFQYVGGAQNEHSDVVKHPNSEAVRRFVVEHLRPSLDRHSFTNVQIVAADLFNHHIGREHLWCVIKDVLQHPDYAKALDVVGYHYPVGYIDWTLDDRPLPEGFLRTGKRFWASEDFSQRGGSFKVGHDYVGKILREYSELRMTKSIAWAPFTSLPPGFLWHNVGFIEASNPRGGHYEVWPALWCVAHVTQFIGPGWTFLDSAHGRFNPASKKVEDANGFYAALKSPDDRDWTLLAATDQPVRARLHIAPRWAAQPVHIWKSDATRHFVRVGSLTPTDGELAIELDGQSVYSLTTTTGQVKGQPRNPIPARRLFPEWTDDFRDYQEHASPRYWVDQEGTFEIVRHDGANVLQQVVPKSGFDWNVRFGGCITYYGGHDATPSFSVEAVAQLDDGYAEVGAAAERTLFHRLQLQRDGSWKLLSRGQPVKEGTLPDFQPNASHTLAFTLTGSADTNAVSSCLCRINDTVLHNGPLPGQAAGKVLPFIGSSYHANRFHRVSIHSVTTHTK